MQKDNSILLSHTGLKYYQNRSKSVWTNQRKYLSKQWIKSDFETQIKEITHNSRKETKK
jgi:hypothetical protein